MTNLVRDDRDESTGSHGLGASSVAPLDAAALRRAFRSAGYTTDAVIDRIGALGQEGLGRNCTVPSDAALADAYDPQAALIRMFLLQQEVPVAAVAGLIDLDGLVKGGLIEVEGQRARALVDVHPFASPDDDASGWVVSDLTPGLDQVVAPTRPDYVLGVSPASTTLAQLVARAPVESALDLGTGCGVQSLHLARHARRVVATDINERAIALAGLTLALSGAEAELRLGSLFEPVAGERFDLIVSNPPYVMSPPSEEASTLAYRETNLLGDGLVEAIVRQAPAHLTPGGSLQLLTNWAVVEGQDWRDRLSSWSPECDLWVIERERLDVFSYVEMWLTDAGLAGSPEWLPAYRRWLAYFDELGIREVGMGWILLTRVVDREPVHRLESWPHAVNQPVGEAFARHRVALEASLLPTDALLASAPRLVDVVQETIGAPGEADPQHIVLRQRRGFLRAIEVGTAEAAVFGALDGDLTVGQVLAAVAEVLGLDPVELSAGMIPLIREAMRDQFLEVPRP
ncbi:MAG TPA: methyltransferase [Arachnia sp.]|nr:methyltransferase [Arachnia sp.]HMT86651.1 methyltransferase [Arachnia sp.]